jgi:DNA-binding transcriptional MocR family regulator
MNSFQSDADGSPHQFAETLTGESQRTETKLAENKLYEQVALRITGMIESGTLRVGDRVPSVRSLSAQQRVSISTVLQAYRTLENQGWLEARPQSGYYIRRAKRNLPPEPEMSQTALRATPVSVGDLVVQILQSKLHPDIIQMGAALGDPSSFPSRQLNRALLAAVKKYPDVINGYDVAPGSHALRVQIARRAMEAGCTLTPDDIVITTGATEALNLCLRAVAKPGDTILLESPTYYSVLQILESLGLCALELPTHPREGLSLAALEYALEREDVKACLLMPSFHNPLGSCMPEANRRQLAKMLAAREIPLIEDDVWGDTCFNAPPRPRAVKSYDEDGLVLLCSSFSKTIAPGYRVGWVAAGRWKQKVEYLKLVSTMANPTLPSLAIAEFLENGGYDHHLRHIRRLHAEQIQDTIEMLEKYFPDGTKSTRPCGGQFLWVELPEQIDTLELYTEALREGISFSPGALFAAKDKYRHCLRLYIGYHDGATTEHAIKVLGRIAAQYAKKNHLRKA